MKYKTHVIITLMEDDGIYYLVEGIEYPNLLTDGRTLLEAKEMAVDAWSLLCTVYEDKGVTIKEPVSESEAITELTDRNHDHDNWSFLIESEDTDEYRKGCTDLEDFRESYKTWRGNK